MHKQLSPTKSYWTQNVSHAEAEESWLMMMQKDVRTWGSFPKATHRPQRPVWSATAWGWSHLNQALRTVIWSIARTFTCNKNKKLVCLAALCRQQTYSAEPAVKRRLLYQEGRLSLQSVHVFLGQDWDGAEWSSCFRLPLATKSSSDQHPASLVNVIGKVWLWPDARVYLRWLHYLALIHSLCLHCTA